MAEPAIGDIIKAISGDVKELVRDEVQLAKAELVPAAKAGGIGAGLLAGAAFFGVSAVFILYFCVVYVLVRLGLPEWASFLIVGAALLLLAGVLGAIGYTMIKKVKAPQRAITAGQGDRRRGQGLGPADAGDDQGLRRQEGHQPLAVHSRNVVARASDTPTSGPGATRSLRRPASAEQEDPRLPGLQVGAAAVAVGREQQPGAADVGRETAGTVAGARGAVRDQQRRSGPPASASRAQSCGSSPRSRSKRPSASTGSSWRSAMSRRVWWNTEAGSRPLGLRVDQDVVRVHREPRDALGEAGLVGVVPLHRRPGVVAGCASPARPGPAAASRPEGRSPRRGSSAPRRRGRRREVGERRVRHAEPSPW